jgi:predicted nucleotide-binding protein
MGNDNRIKILQSFVQESSRVSALNYDEFVSKVSSFIQAVFGDAEYNKFKKLDKSFYRARESSSSMSGYLLGLISNLESDARVQPDVNKSLPLGTNNNQSNFVFVVHGHDNEVKETVARFVEKLGLRTVVLHEQPNHGKTIIEKFEEFSDKISFAIVLLTPDDFGASKSDLKNPKLRARQNVIFELGFFIGKLGRNRVCALRKGDVELPSDYLGVLYIPLDDEGVWRVKVVKEMKAVGLSVNIEEIL